MVQLDGRDHARQRRLLAAPFRADRFHAAFAPAIGKIADRLIEGFADRDAGRTGQRVRYAVLRGRSRLPSSGCRIPTWICSGTWYTALLRFGVNLIGDPEVTRAGLAARDELSVYLRPLVEERRKSQRTRIAVRCSRMPKSRASG